MPVESPQVNDTRSMFADWIELLALTSPSGVASRAAIVRLQAMQSEREHEVVVESETNDELETEILEEDVSILADNIADEIAFRAEVLGDSYPFILNTRLGSWTIQFIPSTSANVAKDVYIFCLLVSALRDGRLIERQLRALVEVDFTRLFQEVSYLAAVQFMDGRGTSFGFPRPDGSRFIEALSQFTASYGVGESRTRPLQSSSRQEKDEGIDIIAWRGFSDGRPGKLLLLGQVASGNNWTDKPVNTAVARFFDWFVTRPATFYVPAIFIPFVQHHLFEPVSAEPYGTAVHDYCRRTEITFGLVVDRLRIVETIAAAPLDAVGQSLSALPTWNGTVLDLARRAA